MKNLTTFKTIPASSVNSLGFSFNNPNLYVFKGRIESSSMASVLVKHKGNSSRNNPQPFKTSGQFANELGGSTTLFNQDAWPVSINASSDKWNGLPSFSIYDVINNGANVSNLSFVYSYWGSNFYENSYTPYFALGSAYYGIDYLGLRLELVFKKPIISNISARGTEIRNPITINWQSNIQDLVDINIIQSGIVRYSVSGTSERSITVPANVLNIGGYDAQITAANNPYDDMGTTSTATQSLTATTVLPTINTLEPSGVNQNVNQPIIVSWSSIGQHTYALRLIQNNVALKTYTGTTETNFTVPKDTFKSGNCNIELTISNSVNGAVLSSVPKVASFIGYGKPDAPVIDAKYIYSNSKPTINWTSEGQVSASIDVYKNDALIESSGEVLGTVPSYTVTKTLDNLTEYIVKIKTKNQFGLWSDVSTRIVKISYVVLPTPDFTLIRDAGGGILINITMPTTATFDGCEIWRKDDYSPWVRLAVKLGYSGQWTDNTVASNTVYYYKIIATSTQGGLSESVVKSEKAYVNNFVLVDIENTNRKSILKYNPQISYKTVTNFATNVFAGAVRPSVESDNTNYKVVSMGFDIELNELNHFENLINTSKVILLRDRRGLKLYGQMTDSLQVSYIPAADLYKISFSFTEVNFIERDIYNGFGDLELLKFDGTWKFDGTQTFNGRKW